MVTISNYAVVENSKTGEEFISLILQGELEMVQSKSSGNFYATARKCSITCTFDEATAAMMIGKVLVGSIVKKECKPYNYTIPETGEVVELNYRYEYSPEEKPTPAVKEVFQPMVAEKNAFSSNGTKFMAQA